MDVSGVFNKLRSTISSTVNEISAALPGNPLLREYDTATQVASAGPCLNWNIYKGFKKSTKAEVAIWVLLKKDFDQFSKQVREHILEVYRRGCLHLTKLRHPRILTVEHGMEESRDSLVFCTEPVFASLANILGKRKNIPEVSEELKIYQLQEVEIKYGLMQVSEALSFLHNSARMIHGNLSPESIVVNSNGAWKLAGLDFCIQNSGTIADPKFNTKDWDTSSPHPTLPNPQYVAPEYILRRSCGVLSDLFSLGVLLHAVYNNGRSLAMDCDVGNIYKVMPKLADKLENAPPDLLKNIPEDVREHEKMLINPDPAIRPDADQMVKLPFFGHVGVMTLQYLDTLLQRENLQKSQFFKGLHKVIPQLPKRVVLHRVLPALTSEFTNHDMIPFVLPNVLIIAEMCDQQQYTDILFPKLIPVFLVQRPIQVLLILLQKMDLLLSKTPPERIQSHILPMLSSSLETSSVKIQELSISIIPTFADQLSFNSLKNTILPKIKKIILEGETFAVKINAIVCIGKLLPGFDKWFVQDEILTFLHKVTSREAGVLMAILGVYKSALMNDKLGITKEMLTSKSLPFLIPLSVESSLNLKQYTSYMSVIKEMMKRVENEHLVKLQQLEKMKVEQDKVFDFTKGEKQNNDNDDAVICNMHDETNGLKDNLATRQHLTLEEKQKLAQNKTMEKMLKGQSQIQPLKMSEQSKLNKPKDLTSSLLQTNLSPMNNFSTKPNQPISTSTCYKSNCAFNSNSLTNFNVGQLNESSNVNQPMGTRQSFGQPTVSYSMNSNQPMRQAQPNSNRSLGPPQINSNLPLRMSQVNSNRPMAQSNISSNRPMGEFKMSSNRPMGPSSMHSTRPMGFTQPNLNRPMGKSSLTLNQQMAFTQSSHHSMGFTQPNTINRIGSNSMGNTLDQLFGSSQVNNAKQPGAKPTNQTNNQNLLDFLG